MTKGIAKKAKTAAIIILIFVILAVIALVLIFKQKNKDSVSLTTVTPSVVKSAAIEQTAVLSKEATATATPVNWKNYSNSQYHFGLEFNDAWEGYTVTSDESLPEKAAASFAFKLKTSDSNFKQTATPLTIYIFPKADFESASKSFASTEITQANGYTYSYRAWDSAPSDLTFLTDKAIADVIKTFKTSN